MPDIGLLQGGAPRPRVVPKPESRSEAPPAFVHPDREVAAPFLAPVDRAIAVVSAVVSEPVSEPIVAAERVSAVVPEVSASPAETLQAVAETTASASPPDIAT